MAALYEKNNISLEGHVDKQAVVVVSSDRGLCGGVHSGLTKAVRLQLKETPTVRAWRGPHPGSLRAERDHQDRAGGRQGARHSGGASLLLPGPADSPPQRTLGSNILFSANEIGRKPPVFAEASFVAQHLLKSGFEFTAGKIFYNQYKCVAAIACAPC